MAPDGIQSVCFVGAGSMGCFNATRAAMAGYRVRLYDVSQAALEQAPQRCQGFAAFLAAADNSAQADIAAVMARIVPLGDLVEATDNVDLVSESVFERLDLKRDVHRLLDQACPAKTILTTNSSYLLLSDFEDVVERGDRIAAMHSYMGSPLVDIVGSRRTSGETLRVLVRYAQSINAVPLVLKQEHPGYVLNAILGPILATAMRLLSEQEGSVEEIDRAWMRYRGAPMGPMGILDLIGLNLVYDSWLHRRDEGSIPGLKSQVLALLKPFVDRGEFGLSTGVGFYRYPDATFQKPEFLESGRVCDYLYQPLLMAMVASAVLLVAQGVADREDIDMAWTVGTSLDAGPFAVLDEIGTTQFLAQFRRHLEAGRFKTENAEVVIDHLTQIRTPG